MSFETESYDVRGLREAFWPPRVAPARRASRTTSQRLALAVGLLRDEAFDCLLTGESAFESLPEVMPRLVSRELPALCHAVTYDAPRDTPRNDGEVACSA